MQSARFFLAIATSAAALALAPNASAYGEIDDTYRGSSIPNTFCGALMLLGDQGLFVTMNGDRLARLRADGTLDTGFGSGGFVPLPAGLTSPYELTTTMSRLADGGFLILGSNAAARLRADGSLDTGYGVNGRSDTYGGSFSGMSAAVQPDGGVIAAVVQGTPFVTFTRVGPDGRIDRNFGVDGVVRVASPAAARLYAWGVQSDGMIQFATTERQADGTLRAQARRYPVDFTPADGAEGRLMPRDVVTSWSIPGARVDAQGRLIIATNDSTAYLSISRFDALGRPDATFGIGGTVATPELGGWMSASLLNLEPDGAITVVAKRENFIIHGARLFAQFVFRFTESGALDATFPNGRRISDTAAFAMDDAGRPLVTVLESTGCAAKRLVGDRARSEAALVEYQYGERYFVTAEGPESWILDTDPAAEKLRRTGRSFGAWLPAAQVPGSLPLCRFNGDAVAGPVGHFYSLQGAECELVRADDARLPRGARTWRFEGLAFSEAPASVDGGCPPSLQPVYRIYNDAARRGGDPNHRFTTDPAVIAEMQAKGWVLEGVAFCAPPVMR